MELMEEREPHPSDAETPRKRPWESGGSRRGCCSPCGCRAAGEGGFSPPGTPTAAEGEAARAVPRRKVIPNPGGDFAVLSLGLAFGGEFHQQRGSKINKKACACQCWRGCAGAWQSGTVNYSSALLPACPLRGRRWQLAGGARRGGSVVPGAGGSVPRRGEAAPVPLSLPSARACAGAHACSHVCVRTPVWEAVGVFFWGGGRLKVGVSEELLRHFGSRRS